MTTLSLVLATVGRTTDLGRAIDALAAQTAQDFELLLIDQNADDRLLPYVEKALAAGLAVRHLKLSPPSLSGARNLGIANALGNWVAFPDDDCWYEPDTVEQVLKALARSPELDGMSINWVEQSASLGQSDTGELLSLSAWRKYRGGEASSISLVMRTSLLRTLGGFDGRLGVGQWFGAAEEIDLVLRALHAGACIARLAEARVHHAFGNRQALPLAQAKQSALQRARGTGAIYAKHKLGSWTVLRGLLAPALKGLAGLSAQSLALGWATSCGRWQGMRAWRRQDS